MTTNACESSLKPLNLERSGGTLVRRKGIYIAHLRGSYEAMGRQHGELATAACGDVVPLYMNQLVEKLVAHAVPFGAAPLAGIIKNFFHWRNRRELGQDMLDHLGALAKAYGHHPVLAERLFLVADIFQYLAGRNFDMLAPPPSCSGIFACGSATRDGKEASINKLYNMTPSMIHSRYGKGCKRRVSAIDATVAAFG